MDPVELRKSMGLAETATDEEVMARATELAARPEPSNTNTNSGTGDQGTGTPPATPPAGTGTGTPTGTGTTTTPPATGITPPATDTGTQAPTTPPPGFALISEANLQELQQGAAAGIAASQTLAKQDEDAFIKRHRRRIGPASNPHAKRVEEHMRREWQRNQGEAEAFAAALHEAPATEAHGHEGGADVDGDAASGWTEQELRNFPELRTQGGN